MNENDIKLFHIAKTYATEEEFKTNNLPQYLLAKKRRILSIAFPTKPKETKKDIKGIYYLYKNNKVVYIGHSFTNCITAIKEMQNTTDIYFNNYKIFSLESLADILVLSLYLANKYKPRCNTNNIKSGNLSFSIENVSQILGTPIKGTLVDLKEYHE